MGIKLPVRVISGNCLHGFWLCHREAPPFVLSGVLAIFVMKCSKSGREPVYPGPFTFCFPGWWRNTFNQGLLAVLGICHQQSYIGDLHQLKLSLHNVVCINFTSLRRYLNVG